MFIGLASAVQLNFPAVISECALHPLTMAATSLVLTDHYQWFPNVTDRYMSGRYTVLPLPASVLGPLSRTSFQSIILQDGGGAIELV